MNKTEIDTRPRHHIVLNPPNPAVCKACGTPATEHPYKFELYGGPVYYDDL